jgi:hypothetical protein
VDQDDLMRAAAPVLMAMSQTTDQLRTDMAGNENWRLGGAMPNEVLAAQQQARAAWQQLQTGFQPLRAAAQRLAEGLSLTGDDQLGGLALGRDAAMSPELKRDASLLFKNAAAGLQNENFRIGVENLAKELGVTTEALLDPSLELSALSEDQIRRGARLVGSYAIGLVGWRSLRLR